MRSALWCVKSILSHEISYTKAISQDANLGAQALVAAVQNTENVKHDVGKAIHAHDDDSEVPRRHKWLERLIPGVEKLTVKYHGGNFVALREPSKPPGSAKIFESMPIYAR